MTRTFLRIPWRASVGSALAAVVLLSVATPGVADDVAPPPEEDPDLEQTVEDDEDIGDEEVVFDMGHVDIGPRIIDDEWQMLARDDSEAPPVWRYPEDLVYYMDDDSIQAAPENEDYDFLPVEPGEDLYMIPQVQDYDIPWLGWNTQDPEVIDELVHGMDIRLHGVEGPGEFQLFLQSGSFEPPDVLWDSEIEEPQDIWADANVHVHANWVFTEPGVYLLDVEMVGELGDDEVGSSRDALRFAVGSDTDPQEAFDADYDPDLSEPEPGGDPEAEGGGTEANGIDNSLLVWGLVIGGIALVLLAALIVAVTRGKRSRALAQQRVSAQGGRGKHES